MKIVSYNISDSKPWKIERLLQMDADVLVVPEITCPEDAHLPEGLEMEWKGIDYVHYQKKWRGLGISHRRLQLLCKPARQFQGVWRHSEDQRNPGVLWPAQYLPSADRRGFRTGIDIYLLPSFPRGRSLFP